MGDLAVLLAVITYCGTQCPKKMKPMGDRGSLACRERARGTVVRGAGAPWGAMQTGEPGEQDLRYILNSYLFLTKI